MSFVKYGNSQDEVKKKISVKGHMGTGSQVCEEIEDQR